MKHVIKATWFSVFKVLYDDAVQRLGRSGQVITKVKLTINSDTATDCGGHHKAVIWTNGKE